MTGHGENLFTRMKYRTVVVHTTSLDSATATALVILRVLMGVHEDTVSIDSLMHLLAEGMLSVATDNIVLVPARPGCAHGALVAKADIIRDSRLVLVGLRMTDDELTRSESIIRTAKITITTCPVSKKFERPLLEQVMRSDARSTSMRVYDTSTLWYWCMEKDRVHFNELHKYIVAVDAYVTGLACTDPKHENAAHVAALFAKCRTTFEPMKQLRHLAKIWCGVSNSGPSFLVEQVQLGRETLATVIRAVMLAAKSAVVARMPWGDLLVVCPECINNNWLHAVLRTRAKAAQELMDGPPDNVITITYEVRGEDKAILDVRRDDVTVVDALDRLRGMWKLEVSDTQPYWAKQRVPRHLLHQLQQPVALRLE